MGDESASDPDLTALPYAVPVELTADAWLPVVRALGVATVVVAGAYLLGALGHTVYYFALGRNGRGWFQLASVVTWPLYVVTIAGGVGCLRRPPRRWRLLRWGLMAMLVARAVVVATNLIFTFLSTTVYAMSRDNIASFGLTAQSVGNGVAGLVLPAALLWLAGRPPVRAVFVAATDVKT